MVFNFLTRRSHFVRLPGAISGDSPVLSGVPQGTVLGPLLFLIMLADINKDISESNPISFADDTRIYSKINDVTDCDSLQQDLNHVYDWASTNNMFFNTQKCYYVSFSPNKYSSLSNVYVNPEYNIISPSSNVLDLGVYMSSNCTFDFHVASVYKRCSNLTGWILRTFNTRETISMMTLFKSLVLSRLDYASQLWSPHLLKSIYLIEKVQRSFTKHITGIKNKPYDERLKLLNLYSVQRRRDRYQIIYLWKIIDGLVPNLSTPITCTYSERRGRSCVVSHVNMGRLGTLSYNSFRWRSIRMFNKLPEYVRIVSSCSVDKFKSQLDKHMRNIVDLPCQSGFNNSLDGGDCLNGGHKPYDERLKLLNLYSVQRRRDRYQIIYLWKIIDGLVPNLSTPITCTYSERRGRSCVVSHVNMGRLGTLSYNSFRWRSIRMFNKLPEYVRIVSSCSVDKFKSQLDKHMSTTLHPHSIEHCGSSLPVWIQQQSRWWRLFEWRSLRGRPGCQLDATEQPRVSLIIIIIIMAICMIIITKLLFSMKHGIITIYIIDFLNRCIQDSQRGYT